MSNRDRMRRKHPSSTTYREPFFEKNKSEHGWYYCKYCGKPLRRKDVQVDHMDPWALSNNNDVDNLCAACEHCNKSKGAQDIETFEIMKELQEDDYWDKIEREIERED